MGRRPLFACAPTFFSDASRFVTNGKFILLALGTALFGELLGELSGNTAFCRCFFGDTRGDRLAFSGRTALAFDFPERGDFMDGNVGGLDDLAFVGESGCLSPFLASFAAFFSAIMLCNLSDGCVLACDFQSKTLCLGAGFVLLFFSSILVDLRRRDELFILFEEAFMLLAEAFILLEEVFKLFPDLSRLDPLVDVDSESMLRSMERESFPQELGRSLSSLPRELGRPLSIESSIDTSSAAPLSTESLLSLDFFLSFFFFLSFLEDFFLLFFSFFFFSFLEEVVDDFFFNFLEDRDFLPGGELGHDALSSPKMSATKSAKEISDDFLLSLLFSGRAMITCIMPCVAASW